jgi:hypothetical protein
MYINTYIYVYIYRKTALEEVIDAGNRNRTTHATESNDESSRSHAICQVCNEDNDDV